MRLDQRRVCVLAAAALAAAGAFGANGTWVFRSGVGTSITNAADWSATANWLDGVVPSTDSGVAYITNKITAAPSTLLAMSIPTSSTS